MWPERRIQPPSSGADARRVCHPFLAARLRRGGHVRPPPAGARQRAARVVRRSPPGAARPRPRRGSGRATRRGGRRVRREARAVEVGVLAHQRGPVAAVQVGVAQPRRQGTGARELRLRAPVVDTCCGAGPPRSWRRTCPRSRARATPRSTRSRSGRAPPRSPSTSALPGGWPSRSPRPSGRAPPGWSRTAASRAASGRACAPTPRSPGEGRNVCTLSRLGTARRVAPHPDGRCPVAPSVTWTDACSARSSRARCPVTSCWRPTTWWRSSTPGRSSRGTSCSCRAPTSRRSRTCPRAARRVPGGGPAARDGGQGRARRAGVVRGDQQHGQPVRPAPPPPRGPAHQGRRAARLLLAAHEVRRRRGGGVRRAAPGRPRDRLTGQERTRSSSRARASPSDHVRSRRRSGWPVVQAASTRDSVPTATPPRTSTKKCQPR